MGIDDPKDDFACPCFDRDLLLVRLVVAVVVVLVSFREVELSDDLAVVGLFHGTETEEDEMAVAVVSAALLALLVFEIQAVLVLAVVFPPAEKKYPATEKSLDKRKVKELACA